MQSKTFEIRDRGTFLPVLAVKLRPLYPADRYLLARSGYGRTEEEQAEYILLTKLDGGKNDATSDPYSWRDRTMQVAHQYIIEKWDTLESGDVVDVEYILSETKQAKESEAKYGVN